MHDTCNITRANPMIVVYGMYAWEHLFNVSWVNKYMYYRLNEITEKIYLSSRVAISTYKL